MTKSKGLLRAWGAAALTVMGVIAAAVSQAIYSSQAAGHQQGRYLIISLCGAVVAGSTPVIDAAVRSRRRRDAAEKIKDAREEEVVAINDALDPLVETLGQLVMTEPPDRPAAAQRLLTQALNSASQVIGTGRTRVSFFRAEAAAEPYRLVCQESAGRHTAPKTSFRQDRDDGAWVIGLLERDEHHFCDNVTEHPPPGWDANRKRTYQTFISVPASVGKESVGMMTADAPAVGQLEEQDIPLLRVIGTIIAAGVKIAEQSE